MTPEQRVLRARIAAHVQWAVTEDRTARSAPGRNAFLARRAAEHLRKAHMARLALASSKARAARKGSGGNGS